MRRPTGKQPAERSFSLNANHTIGSWHLLLPRLRYDDNFIESAPYSFTGGFYYLKVAYTF